MNYNAQNMVDANEVLEFVEEMIDDHQNFIDKAQNFLSRYRSRSNPPVSNQSFRQLSKEERLKETQTKSKKPMSSNSKILH